MNGQQEVINIYLAYAKLKSLFMKYSLVDHHLMCLLSMAGTLQTGPLGLHSPFPTHRLDSEAFGFPLTEVWLLGLCFRAPSQLSGLAALGSRLSAFRGFASSQPFEHETVAVLGCNRQSLLTLHLLTTQSSWICKRHPFNTLSNVLRDASLQYKALMY